MAITRFAPSPTGYLHIGGLRTALYNYLWARKTGGEFKLRIEDTDMARNSEDALKAILQAFEWVGLDYDGEVEYQSKRMDIYKGYIQKLLDEDKAYYCYMSKEELDALRESQTAAGLTPRYDGRYRDFKGTPPSDISPVIRIKAPQEGEICFIDGVKSDMVFSCDQVDDFIIARSDGTPIYNFVVVIDDHLMGITEVLRGDDHLTNTAKQIVIYEALGFNVPKFYHIPMINNPEGKKLSKRDGATDVMEYKNLGYLPEALLNFLVRLGWSHGDQEIFSMEEMLTLFDPNNINKSSSCYNAEKLLWLNAHYIKNKPNQELAEILKFYDCEIHGHDKVEMILDLCKERAGTMLELKNSIELIINTPSSYDETGVNKFINEDIVKILEIYAKMIMDYEGELHLACDYETITKPFIAQYALKMPQLFQPIRLALTGSTQAPSVYDIMAILGKNEVLKRIYTAIEKKFS
ncbi:glutamate--tRNA ligase [Arcobacter sp. FWKO B]|uniref:glutamate--tRNA ligase n=1 Tax=Arcobacter sp. FWKO B TaxID=2593672 RepID=UPI0018A624C5|nr:glutamate--tRNA ligase [Arcobacter sp. FWKO B]QOG12240.1 glutamate--tRNA ligase [Arcobacter sp. FWKO B]